MAEDKKTNYIGTPGEEDMTPDRGTMVQPFVGQQRVRNKKTGQVVIVFDVDATEMEKTGVWEKLTTVLKEVQETVVPAPEPEPVPGDMAEAVDVPVAEAVPEPEVAPEPEVEPEPEPEVIPEEDPEPDPKPKSPARGKNK